MVNSPMCTNQKDRVKYKDQIDALVGEWTAKQSSEEIIAQLKEISVPCSIVPTYDQPSADHVG